MLVFQSIQNILNIGTQQLITWVTSFLPQIFLFLILLNAMSRMIGRSRIERFAKRCASNVLLRYLVLPFLAAVVLGNPLAISMGCNMPERYKPAYYASASYHCHTNSGIFQHINPMELFIWLGIANGVMACGCDLFPLALRYLLAGLLANLVSGYATEIITGRLARKQAICLSEDVELPVQLDAEEQYVPDETEGTDTELNIYRPITITRGDSGEGGPITVTPTKERHTVLYIVGGGNEPEPLDKIIALSGMVPLNGNKESCPDEEIALVIIDCGGTLRCGIYPSKGIPTVNILPTGRSGPMAKYMTEDLYVSDVTSAGVYAGICAEDVCPETACSASPENNGQAVAPDHSGSQRNTHAAARIITALAMGLNRIISIFHQSARDSVHTCLELILPFMGFVAIFIGICKGSGLTQALAACIEPLSGSIIGLMLIGFICSIPGLSAILGAGAGAAQVLSVVIGEMIASGSIPVAMALPALFAVNCQCACDFIPVGLGMTAAKPETIQVGIQAVTLSRFATGWLRILIALLFSIGLYA